MRGGYHATFTIDRETLVKLYWGQEFTCKEIGQSFGVHADTIFKKLGMYDIPRRSPGRRPKLEISEEVLRRLYCDQELGSGTIANMLGVSTGTVQHYLDKFGIPVRSQVLAVSLANKSRVPWQRGLTKATNPSLRIRARGAAHPLFGRCGTEHPYFGHRHTDEWRARMSQLRKGKPMSARARLNMSLGAKRLWANAEYKDKAVKLLRQAQQKRPNKGEQKLVELFENERLPYKYVGDGSLIIYGFNPDFIHSNGQKKIIEFFGDYWHKDRDDLPWERTEQGRRELFAQLGFSTLVIWQHDLKDMNAVLEKVNEFTEVQ